MENLNSIFKDKKIVVTGHTGFKGSWLTLWLSQLGAEVIGVSKDDLGMPSNFLTINKDLKIEDIREDVCNQDKLYKIFEDHKPDFVFHLAAQALVRPSYEMPMDTFITNAIGTTSVLEALRKLSHEVTAVIITSDKAYDNVEWVWGYRETDKLGGKDPYSASKGMAELAIRSYFESYFNNVDTNVRIGITRAGNVIGGGDWALDRIVPDCMKAWSKDIAVDIRSPEATRPWQHVLEPISGYLTLAASLFKNVDLNGEAYNFGPPADQNYSVGELIDEMSKFWNKVQWNDVSNKTDNPHEAGLLKLNCDKALSDLNWHATLNFKETVKMTVEWYKYFYEHYKDSDSSMFEFSISQINEYIKLTEHHGKD